MLRRRYKRDLAPAASICNYGLWLPGVYEQFIVTDIDNYLVYSKADSYFKQFGELFIKYLMDLGYPL